MNPTKVTPKDFFLWLGAMVALYVSVFSLITLYFAYIDKFFPDVLDSYVDPYSGSIRFAMASLLVLFPAFLFLMRIIRKDIAQVPEKAELWVRRWVLYLTLFVAGVTIAIDLITLINYFLGGDLTTRFLLKVAVVLLIMSVALWYFLAELKGRWNAQPEISRVFGYGVGVVMLSSVVAGFLIIGSPSELRDLRFDNQRVSDLQSIQWQIVSYWQQHEVLPPSLVDLYDPIGGYIVPVDPQTGVVYEYIPQDGLSFELCATFARESSETSSLVPMVTAVVGAGAEGNWNHPEGYYCFERVIDPLRYPPLSKIKN